MTPEATAWSLLASLPMVVGVVVVALVTIAWQLAVMRRRRPPRKRRMIALVVLVLALALLALGPARRAATADRLWLVTEGMPAEALAEMTGEVLILAAAASAHDRPPAPGGTVIPDAGWLARHRPGATLAIAGDGLDRWDWSALDGLTLDLASVRGQDAEGRPLRRPLPPGVDAIGWSRSAVVGGPWAVEGHIRGLGRGTMRLRGPGGEVAECPVAEDGQFVLHATPRVAGRWRYQLAFEATPTGPESSGPKSWAGTEQPSAQAGSEEASLETVDVQVAEARLPTVLWLEPAPRFETRHLKSWLSGAGGALAVRTATSRDRLRFERHNLANRGVTDRGLARLDGDLLARFDVVVTDRAHVATLPATTQEALRAAVAGGLGLLLLPGSTTEPVSPSAAPPSAATIPDWLRFETTAVDLATGAEDHPDPAADDDRMPMRVAWPDGTASTALASAPRELLSSSRNRPVIVDPAGRVLVAERRLGNGKVATSLVEQTYRWVLEGNPDHHRRFWSQVLGSLARPRSGVRIHAPAGPVRSGAPLTWTVDLPTLASPPDAVALDPEGDERPLAWQQDLLRANRWRATLWPRRQGWHGLRVGEEVAWLDVQGAASWMTLRQADRRLATAQHALHAGAPTSVAPASLPPAPRPVGRLALFVLALAAATALWLDERLAPPASAAPM